MEGNYLEYDFYVIVFINIAGNTTYLCCEMKFINMVISTW